MRKSTKQLGLETLERREVFSANSLAMAGNLETNFNIGIPPTSFENQANWHGYFQAGEFTGWLDDFRNSETFASFNVLSADRVDAILASPDVY